MQKQNKKKHRDINLILFFTYGVSLQTWVDTGLIDREILLYKMFLENHINVTFITYGDERDYQYQAPAGNIKVVPFYFFTKKPSNKIVRLMHSLLLPLILRKEIKKADLIKTNQLPGSLPALVARFLYRKKMIVRCGFEWYRFIERQSCSLLTKMFAYLITWFSYHFADGIILTSENHRKYIIQKYQIWKKKKIKVIPNYIDTSIFKPMNKLKKKKNHLLFIGRLSEQKNLFNLFRSIKASNYTLDVVGDGKLRNELIKYARKNRLNINFLGRFPNNNLPRIINQYEIFILPSLYEGNPKALLEAMSCGLAIIGADVEGINNVIKHMQNGYLCKTDSKSIRKAIDKLATDKLLRKTMGEAARYDIVQNCNIEKILRLEMRFYSTILSC